MTTRRERRRRRRRRSRRSHPTRRSTARTPPRRRRQRPAPPPSRPTSATPPGPRVQPGPPTTPPRSRIPGPPPPAAPPAAKGPPTRARARRLARPVGQGQARRPLPRPPGIGARISQRLAKRPCARPPKSNPRNAAPWRPFPAGLPRCCRRDRLGPRRRSWRGTGPRSGPMTPVLRWPVGSGQPARIPRPRPRCPCNLRYGRLVPVLGTPPIPLTRRTSPG